jgi:ABC-type transport system involved in multi-copper enzyme maturation permease subunit
VIAAIIGQSIFQLEPFGWDRLLRLLVNLFLLQMSLYSLTLLFSSFGREAGRVAMLAVLVAIVSYLVNVIATLWNRAAFMRPYSLHTYYDPRDILVFGNLAPSSVVVLGVFTLAATTAAVVRFLTRDLP